jgi:hypothetical protein
MDVSFIVGCRMSIGFGPGSNAESEEDTATTSAARIRDIFEC